MKDFQLTPQQATILQAFEAEQQPKWIKLYEALSLIGMADSAIAAVVRDTAFTIAMQYQHAAFMAVGQRMSREEWLDLAGIAFDQYQYVSDLAYEIEESQLVEDEDGGNDRN